MKLYSFNLKENLNYYFIVLYTQINFRLFTDFSFLPKNFIKKYKSITWFEFNYKCNGLTSKILSKKYPLLICNDSNTSNNVSLKVFSNFKQNYQYNNYLEIVTLNFNINRFIFDEIKNIDWTDEGIENITNIFGTKFLNPLLFNINYIYIFNLFKKIKYLTLFKNYNILYCLNIKLFDKINLQKNQLNIKPTFSLNFKYL